MRALVASLSVVLAASTVPAWKTVTPTLGGHVDPTSSNACNRGDVVCIDSVATEMRRRLTPLSTKCDHNAPFGYTYYTVTKRFRAGWPWAFVEPAYIAHLDAVFARNYFDAYDAWRRSQDDVPMAWATAFDAARDKTVTGLGDMLLGMNAHITYDLPFVLEEIGLARSDGSSAYEDFTTANAVLADAQGDSIDGVARRFDPEVADMNVPSLFVGRDGFVALIGTWRAESWARAGQLLGAPTREARDAVAREIAATAAARALLIQAATSYLPVVGSSKPRDRFCRSRQ